MKRLLAALSVFFLAGSAYAAQFKGLNLAILNSSNPVAASGGGGGGGSTFANDNFGGGAGNLESHTSDSGHSWTAGTSGGLAITAGGKVYCNNNGAGFRYYISATPPSADYYAELLITVGASGNVSIGPAIRVSNSDDTCYFVRWNDGSWELYRNVTGSISSIGTYTGDIPTGAGRTCRLTATGNIVKVLIDGVERISVDDTGSAISATGFAGLFSYYADDDNGAARYGDTYAAGAN